MIPREADSEHRARVGIMLQSGGIDPRATAREVLALHASFYRQPREVDELLGLVELGPLGRARYRTLSGGERQRLALAIAIVGRAGGPAPRRADGGHGPGRWRGPEISSPASGTRGPPSS